VSGPIGLSGLVILAVAFEVTLLAITGGLHLARPAHLAVAAAQHRDAAAIPTWLRPLERPLLVGSFEIACAALAAASAVSGRVALIAVGQSVVALFAAGLVSFVALLRRAPQSLPCGCHPYAGRVTATTYAPAVALLVVALAAGAGALLLPALHVPLATVLPTIIVGAIGAATVLLYTGAATPAVEV
jgi:hypothetical protein